MSHLDNGEPPQEVEEGPKLHPDFDEGDGRFISSDGTEFKVSKKRLSARSNGFKGMFKLPKSDDSHNEPIAIDIDASILAIFFTLITAPIPALPNASYKKLCEVYKLCDKFDCATEVTEVLRHRLADGNALRCWEIVRMASLVGDRHLACLALAKATEVDETSLVQNMSWTELTKLSSNWGIELAALCFDGPYTTIVQTGRITRDVFAATYQSGKEKWRSFEFEASLILCTPRHLIERCTEL
ncbi:hypothetical protein IAU59_000858 [Kwoniella sp. CBS 9459]